jgi:phosphate transport system permease protein
MTAPIFVFADNTAVRNRTGGIWQNVFRASTLIAILALAALLLNIINQVFGYVIYEAKVAPTTLAVNGVELDALSKDELVKVLESKISKAAFAKLEKDGPFPKRTSNEVLSLIYERVVKLEVKETWGLWDSLTKKAEIETIFHKDFPEGQLVFESWLSPGFLTRPQSSNAVIAGIRTAVLGSMWTILFTILVAFPLGVGAAIYLEEYSTDNWLNRLIQTNINNLAGVPSIVYGILGLAIFVRAMEPITSGSVFGIVDPNTANGRTVLSAGFTLALLVLPIIIINAQEAIRSVPQSLRKASYGIGATKWQTVWSHVLPNAMPGILTGTILAISRAIGETAPLVVIGASTFITFDPSSPFSKFTTLPIQIYQWTSRPQAEFRNLAAAAIVVLMVMLLSLNAVAIILRNRLGRKF